jgi:hypothetical protein
VQGHLRGLLQFIEQHGREALLHAAVSPASGFQPAACAADTRRKYRGGYAAG